MRGRPKMHEMPTGPIDRLIALSEELSGLATQVRKAAEELRQEIKDDRPGPPH